MRMLLASAALLFAAACTTSTNQIGVAELETVGNACVDVSGHMEPAFCTLQPPSKNSMGFCQCPSVAQKIDAPLCLGGEKQPMETAEYRQAVLAAIRGDGSLVGDTYNGKPMCVPPRQT